MYYVHVFERQWVCAPILISMFPLLFSRTYPWPQYGVLCICLFWQIERASGLLNWFGITSTHFNNQQDCSKLTGYNRLEDVYHYFFHIYMMSMHYMIILSKTWHGNVIKACMFSDDKCLAAQKLFELIVGKLLGNKWLSLIMIMSFFFNFFSVCC